MGRGCRYAGAAVDGRWGEGAGTQGRQWVIGRARAQVRRGGSGWSVGRGYGYAGACGYIGGNIVIIPSPAPGRYAGVAVDGRWGEGAGRQKRVDT